MKEKFHLFWSGPFSQWEKSKFVIGGFEYNCAEQWMMAEKAKIFKDTDTLTKILKSKDPREQKALGRQVKNFDPLIWNQNAKIVVYRGTRAKFSQNKDLEIQLKEVIARGEYLVEASPYDKIWGIGLMKDDPRCLDRATWQGTNWLGEVLMLVSIMICSSKNNQKRIRPRLENKIIFHYK